MSPKGAMLVASRYLDLEVSSYDCTLEGRQFFGTFRRFNYLNLPWTSPGLLTESSLINDAESEFLGYNRPSH